MKKLILLFLSFCYLVILSSFTPVENCCKMMDQGQNCMAISSIGTEENPATDCLLEESLSKEKELGCCKNELNISILDDALVSSTREQLWLKNLPSTTGSDFILAPSSTQALQPTPAFTHSKIPIQGNALYVLHCVYRI